MSSECIPNCDTDAKEFCGLNDKCYQYSCENWYQYGDIKYTRHRTLEAPALTCQDIDPEEDSYEYLGMAGIVHGCNVKTGTRMPFTRECTAILDDEANFTCHEMSPNTDFQTYIDQVDNETINCANNETALYIYANWVSFDTFVGEGKSSSFSLSKAFNSSLAGKTIYSSLVADYPNGPPNITDPDDKKAPPNESSQGLYSIKIFVFTVIIIGCTILM